MWFSLIGSQSITLYRTTLDNHFGYTLKVSQYPALLWLSECEQMEEQLGKNVQVIVGNKSQPMLQEEAKYSYSSSTTLLRPRQRT